MSKSELQITLCISYKEVYYGGMSEHVKFVGLQPK